MVFVNSQLHKRQGNLKGVLCKPVGDSKAGEEVARFKFTWKIKRPEA
jgi:hypothetical protein